MKHESIPVVAQMVRVALYLRVSTGRQAEHDLSIPDQRRQALSHCASKGWEIVSEFVEPGASATDDRRPEFQRMMDASAEHPSPFDVILVHSFSRFFRDQFQLEFYVRRLAKNGVRLVSITQDLGDDPMSVMMRQIMALFDEYQSKENAKHTLRAMRENARQGFWNGSKPPFGYRVVAAEQRGMRVKKKLDIEPLQAERVRQMFALARVGEGDSGPFGLRKIADHLNERGIRTSGGGRWGTGAVHQILRRKTYAGTHQFNVKNARTKERKPDDEIIEVPVPAIISTEEYEEVQALLRSRNAQWTPTRHTTSSILLGGSCFCGKCGGAMTLRTSGRSTDYRYYTCSTKARQGRTGCSGVTVPMDDLDQTVVDFIERRFLNPERVNEILSSILDRRVQSLSKEREHIDGMRMQAAAADEKLSRLYAAIEEGVADPSDPNLKQRLSDLRMVRDAAKSDVERAESTAEASGGEITPDMIRRFIEGARRRLRDDDGKLRRHFVKALAQRVDVCEDEVRIVGSAGKLITALAGAYPRVNPAATGVRSYAPKWLPGRDSNPRPID